MSPQSRANSNTTTSCNNNGSWSSNACLGAASSLLAATQQLQHKTTTAMELHKIDSTSTTNTTTTANSTTQNGNPTPSLKRTVAHISSPKSQQFLASYGSAFLSGIFADIAETSTTPQDTSNGDQPIEAFCYDTAPHDDTNVSVDLDHQPSNKKARTSSSTSVSRQKSYKCLSSALAEGTVVSGEVLSPSAAVSPSPRFNTSTAKFNDQVRELQDMAFPSLPKMPATVSATSLPHLDSGASKDESGSSYGWFVSTDDDTNEDQNSSPGSMFLPDMNPSDLTFKAITAPSGGNQEVEVQQALAADTIDDVLGDFL